MDSLLPSFQTQLPEPQLFVELRRVKVKESPAEDEISDHRRNIHDLLHTSNSKVEVKKPEVPVVSEVPKLQFNKAYKKNLRNKIKTLYKPKKQGEEKIITLPYGQKFADHSNSTRKKLHRKISKKRLKLDVEKKDQGFNPVLSREDSINDFYKTEDNDFEERNEMEVIEDYNDQVAQESIEDNSFFKPLSKVVAKKDDVIFQQMNFWRNQIESKRLKSFSLQDLKNEDQGEKDIREILENTFIKPITNNRRRIFIKAKNAEDDNSDVSWEPRNIEKVITDELKEIQSTLMVTNNNNNFYQIKTNLGEGLDPVERSSENSG